MENKLTVNYATAWLMGVDPAATGARLKQYRNANHLTQEGLSGILTDGGDPAPAGTPGATELAVFCRSPTC